MYCSKCGKEIASGSVFCNFCGENQNDAIQHAIIVDLNVNDAALYIHSIDKQIMENILAELLKNNPKLKTALDFTFKDGIYCLSDKFFRSNERYRYQSASICESYLLTQGFLPTRVPDRVTRKTTFVKK